jgi:predicted nucleic acid-binding protein
VYLVDSSVWIETFRKHRALKIESHVNLEEVVTCLPVIQEVLQGFRDERAFRIAKESMLAFPIVESPLTQQVYVEAVQLYRSSRRSGLTIRSGVDCLIAVCALRNGLTLIHKDRDYSTLAKICALEVETL